MGHPPAIFRHTAYATLLRDAVLWALRPER